MNYSEKIQKCYEKFITQFVLKHNKTLNTGKGTPCKPSVMNYFSDEPTYWVFGLETKIESNITLEKLKSWKQEIKILILEDFTEEDILKIEIILNADCILKILININSESPRLYLCISNGTVVKTFTDKSKAAIYATENNLLIKPIYQRTLDELQK